MDTPIAAESPAEAMERAVARAGSEQKLADAVGVRQSYISKAKRTGRVSDRIAIAIHAWSNGDVPGSALRPDLWLEPAHVPVREMAGAP
jgi:DNA-binding transcriptional regulator YdaS (Cro superfamily)